MLYSACSVTLGIGAEGFGYPVAESLACGVPCIVGSYGGQAEFLPRSCQVDPVAFFHEGPFSSRRPVFRVEDWVAKVAGIPRVAGLPPDIDWWGETLWPSWEEWFRRGL